MMATDLQQDQVAMAAERAFRFGIAAGHLGLDAGRLTVFIQRLAPELSQHMWAAVSSDLRNFCLLLRADPGDGSGFMERLCEAAIGLQQHRESAWFRDELLHGLVSDKAKAVAGASLSLRGVSLLLELSDKKPVGEMLKRQQRGPSPRLPAEAAARLFPLCRHLADTCDTVASDEVDGQRVLRLGFVLSAGAGPWVMPVMEAIGVTLPQRHHFAATVEPLAGAAGRMTVRLAATESGVVPEIAVGFASVSMDLVLPIWRTFRPMTDLGGKVGALVGALGAEGAEELEIRYRTQDPPDLRVTFACSPQDRTALRGD